MHHIELYISIYILLILIHVRKKGQNVRTQ